MKLSAMGTRWAAWGLLAATFAMGAALLLTSWSSYRSVMAASAGVTRSQGDAFLRALFTLGRHEASEADLQAFVEEQRTAGLQYVAVFDHGRLVAAGRPLGGPADTSAAPSREAQVRRLDDRFRLVLRPEPPDPPRPGRPAPPTITIEYEPVLARQLESDAVRALRWSAAAAAVLLVIAILFARMLLQREVAERRYEQGRRLAALGEMSSVLAHELRNPLASLKGHAQLLVERLPAGRERTKAETIVLEAQRLEALSASLLDFTRSGPIARSEVDPLALLASAASSVDASRIRVDSGGAPPRWPLDGSRMRQVLTNLLSNAVEASPEGSPVEAGVASRQGRLLFAVRDHGEGLPAGEEQRIFEPFFTTRAKGTGLGLAIAQRIVEMHGGTVRATNHPEGGALFEVELPRG
ncbi:MAG TPA: ATP-binding protein [Vicinamibacteria bacterium]|nr:ATP-binding protein [Vicinamibacteria bacterium]